jgi:hypothetical protein
MKKRIWATLIAIDQVLAALLLGYADETLSAATYRLGKRYKRWAVMRNIIDTLFFWDTSQDATGRTVKHCEGSYIAEKRRRQLPHHYWDLVPKDPS